MKPIKQPLVVGIAGIMGSGKSTVAGVFEALGAKRVDADQLGKAMLREPAVKAAVIEAFGSGVTDAGGEIDTVKLGKLAFASPDNARRLDRVTREPLISRIKARVEELAPTSEVIVVDAALLPEWNAKPWLDVLLVVDSEEEHAVARLEANPRFKHVDVRARMKHQFERSRKTAAADMVIPNYGSLEDLKARARAIFRTLGDMRDKGKG
ncbi:MAG TPA: dephospho-CoA kinase [bacterium]|nr:dephospho-CoA kinase [bacterium]